MCECKGVKPTRVVKATRGCNFGAQSAGLNPSGEWSECEHICWDPKDV